MKRYLLISAILLSGCSGFLSGNSAPEKVDPTPPANLPPAGYSSTNFVDARGCNYIRTEYENRVNWVPQVSISGSHICGASGANLYAVGEGIQDIHGTLAQPQVASAEPTVTQVSTDRAAGGIQWDKIFGQPTSTTATIIGVPEEVTSVPAEGTPVAIASVAPAPTPTPAPVTVPSVPAVEPVAVPVTAAVAEPTPVATPAPAPVVTPTPAPEPVAVPAPAPEPVAPVAEAAPSIPAAPAGQPRTLRGNVMSVSIGNSRSPASRETVDQLKAAGYQVVQRSGSTFVIPPEGVSAIAIKRTLDQMGFGNTLVVGVAF